MQRKFNGKIINGSIGVLFVLCSFYSSISFARTGLISVYMQALKNDPVIDSARETWLASRETLPQNLAPLYPSLSATSFVKTNESMSKTQGDPRTRFRFRTRGYGLSLSQKVIDFSQFIKVSRAENSVKSSWMTYLNAEQELMFRVAERYIGVLKAQATLKYAIAQKDAAKKQLDLVSKRKILGIAPALPVTNARSFYENSSLSVTVARNALVAAKELLRETTGRYYDSIADLNKRIPLLKPYPRAKSHWLKEAMINNPSILSSYYDVKVAEKTLGINVSGHLPTLTANASYDYTYQNDLSSTDSRFSESWAKGASLNLSIPIFEGGLVNSQVREAKHNYYKAQDTLYANKRDVWKNVKTTYSSLLTDIQKVILDRAVVKAAEDSYRITQRSFELGKESMINVLSTLQNLYTVKGTQAQDRYSYVLNWLRLKQNVGLISYRDLKKLDSWLKS